MSKFQRLIRFEDPQGQVHYGEIGSSVEEDSRLIGLEVSIYEGSTPWSEDFRLIEKRAKIAKVRLLTSFKIG
jgi:hypothetical protein